MSARHTSFRQKTEAKHPTATAIEARMRANGIVEGLATALGVSAAYHPVAEAEEVPIRYIRYRRYYIDVYLEVHQTGLARATGSWVLILSGEDGVATRSYHGLNLLPAINHILRFGRNVKYRRLCLEQTS
jgi:hypothetical protein